MFSALFIFSLFGAPGAAALQGLPALDLTGADLKIEFRLEYNRTFLFCFSESVIGGLTLNDRFRFAAGFASGTLGDEPETRLFGAGSANIVLFPAGALSFGFAYIFHGIPGFEMRSNSIRPMLSYTGRRWTAALGMNLQFTRFFGEYQVFEPVFVFSASVVLLQNYRFSLKIRGANYSDFDAGNMAKYSFALSGAYRLNERVSLTSAIELMQSGSIVLAATFYGFAFMGGVRFSW